MLRRLLRPRLVVAHVVVLVAVLVMVSLGFWQLRRLDEARSFNQQLEARSAAAPVDARTIATGDPDELAFRTASVTGRYVVDEELLHLARAYRGRSGNHVLTPLVTEQGTTILVDRGWVPAAMATPPVHEARPPSGEVTVTGQLLASQEYASFGARDAEEGDLQRVLRVNLPRIEQQLPDELRPFAPVYLQLREQVPPPGRFPLPAEAPQLDDGPHLSYAVQWFLFALTATIAYAMFVRSRLRDEAGSNGHVSRSNRPRS